MNVTRATCRITFSSDAVAHNPDPSWQSDVNHKTKRCVECSGVLSQCSFCTGYVPLPFLWETGLFVMIQYRHCFHNWTLSFKYSVENSLWSCINDHGACSVQPVVLNKSLLKCFDCLLQPVFYLRPSKRAIARDLAVRYPCPNPDTQDKGHSD